MQTVTTVGLDIAKSVLQVHGIDAKGDVIIRRQLKRRYVLAFFQKLPSCLVGIEACASSHHWSRELTALGRTVRLMPPAYVKTYVKRQKNDMADAEAICEAVTRATVRFVPTKTPEQQSCLMLHRTRHLFIRQQTAVINSIRAHLAEFGIVAPVGRNGVEELLRVVADPDDRRVPEVARVGRTSICRPLAPHIPHTARRSAVRGTDALPVGHQPQDREGHRHHDAVEFCGARRRGHRIKLVTSAYGTKPTSRHVRSNVANGVKADNVCSV